MKINWDKLERRFDLTMGILWLLLFAVYMIGLFIAGFNWDEFFDILILGLLGSALIEAHSLKKKIKKLEGKDGG